MADRLGQQSPSPTPGVLSTASYSRTAARSAPLLSPLLWIVAEAAQSRGEEADPSSLQGERQRSCGH